MAIAHRIFVDLQAAQSAAHAERGIARYSIELTRAMLRLGAPIDAIATEPHLPPPRGLPEDLRSSPLLTTRTAESLARVARNGPVAYHLMSPIELELPPLRTVPESALRRSDALVAVLYDLIPLVFADRYLRDPRVREPYLARLALLRQADLLLAISEHTRRDAIEHLGVEPTRVVNIGGGVPDVSPPDAGADPFAEVKVWLPIDRPFVLTVTGWEWRKNTEGLIRAFGALEDRVRDDFQLVVACKVPPEGEAEWRAEAAAVGLRPEQLVVTGYIEDALLRSLYQATSLFVFPSRYEGYGLPVAEAARCGAAVLTSDSSSLPEILELPESTFPCEDTAAMSRAIARGLTDEAFRARLLDAGARAAELQTWDNVGRRTVAAYESLGSRSRPRSLRARRPRIAFVGPLPPTESGIAVYNQRVLAAMDASDLELHLFVEGEGASGAARRSTQLTGLGERIYPVEALDESLDPHDYDLFVHTLGNSRYHVRSFDLARRHPGVLWLHDAYLIGLHLEWSLWQIRSGRRSTDVLSMFREEMAQMYGDRVAPGSVLVEPLSHRAFVEREVYLSAGIVRSARHLVVNSQLALDMVRADLAPGEALPPVTLLHHAVPARGPRRAGADRSRPLVVALGVVHAIKRPAALIEAVAQLDPAVELVFVGPCDDEARAIVVAAAARAGIGERVRVTGHVESDQYIQWIDQASVAVQLRDVSFGESSGAVHDAIAAGLPVITSIESCRGLPADVVEMVALDAPPTEIAAKIRSVLDEPAHADAMRRAGAEFAAEWTFDRVAREIADVVRQTLAR